MRAECQNGHMRDAMDYDVINRYFFCKHCLATITPDAIWENVPKEYRPSGNPLGSDLQALLDYEIVGVMTTSGLFIEYPKLGTGGG